MPEWTEWPQAGNFRIRPKRRGSEIRTVLRRIAGGRRNRGRWALARVMMIATGVAGVACLGMTEINIAFGAAAIPLLAAALILQSRR